MRRGGEVFLPAYVLLTLLVGFLIGLEIPFLTRLLEGTGPLRDTLAHVLSLDYLGALAATVAFPLLLLPAFGLFASGVGFGLVNVTIAVVVLLRFRDRLTPALRRGCWIATAGAAALLLAGLAASDLLLDRWEQQLYEGRVIHHERTRFQRIVLTAERGDLRLYLDGNLQASSRDEYRYHEALAGVGLAAVAQPRRVLVLGGGDGLAVRELRRDPRVEHVTLMDLDPAVTRLAREHPRLRALNGDALAAGPGDGSKDGARDGPALEILHGDAIRLLRETRDSWDLILVDFPDPNSTALARLYVKEAYGLLEARLAAGGAVVTQATSPLHAPAAFWGIVATVGAVFPGALPYHVQVPSFGQWGFVLATRTPVSVPAVAARIRDGGRFLTPEVFRAATVFAPDVALARAEAQVSTIDRPQVLSDYRAGWRSWGR